MMNRVIKFRAWYSGDNTISPQMCDVVAIEKESDYYDKLFYLRKAK